MNRLTKFMIVSFVIVALIFLVTDPLNKLYLNYYEPEPVEDNLRLLIGGKCVDAYPGISKEDYTRNQKFLYEQGYINEVVRWCD